jgi:hypothetical protein
MASKAAFYEVGRYLVRLGKHDVIEKPKGPQLTIRFTVLGKYDNMGEVDASVQSYERTYYRVLNEKTAEYAIEDLKNLGYDLPTFTGLDPSDPDGFVFDGREADMWCGHENTEDGGSKEKWTVARRGGGSTEIEGKRADRKALRNLDNLFGKALKESAPAKPAPAQRQPVATAAGITDDYVPF